jgi:hypothetical protein
MLPLRKPPNTALTRVNGVTKASYSAFHRLIPAILAFHSALIVRFSPAAFERVRQRPMRCSSQRHRGQPSRRGRARPDGQNRGPGCRPPPTSACSGRRRYDRAAHAAAGLGRRLREQRVGTEFVRSVGSPQKAKLDDCPDANAGGDQVEDQAGRAEKLSNRLQNERNEVE